MTKKAKVGSRVRIELHGHDVSVLARVTAVKSDGHIKAVLEDEDHPLHKHEHRGETQVRELVVAPDLYQVIK